MQGTQQLRIDNIAHAENSNISYYRRIRVRDYIPGQANYNLGDYPQKISVAPTEYDKKLIEKLACDGVKLIQVHEDWNDPVRLYGGDKFNAVDRQGMKDFIELCHANGIKVIAYVSSGYFQITDPDWRDEFSRVKDVWSFNCFSYTKGCHGIGAWREFIIPKTLGVMDEYGFDGIYNDWGYDKTSYLDGVLPAGFYDAEVEDLLAQIYSEVKKRGGIYKLHCDRNNAPPCRDKVCDYLWIGEWIEGGIGIGKDYEPYVVPCQDRHFDASKSLEEYIASVVPFMQFPLLKTGRPLRGNNVDLPNVTYFGGDEQDFFKNVRNYNASHPDGPFAYSLWSSIPDDPREPEVWAKYLALYTPMTQENSIAYIGLERCKDILSPLHANIAASMFVNENIYLVVSNLSDSSYDLKLSDVWRDRETQKISDNFTIEKNKIIFLIK